MSTAQGKSRPTHHTGRSPLQTRRPLDTLSWEVPQIYSHARTPAGSAYAVKTGGSTPPHGQGTPTTYGNTAWAQRSLLLHHLHPQRLAELEEGGFVQGLSQAIGKHLLRRRILQEDLAPRDIVSHQVEPHVHMFYLGSEELVGCQGHAGLVIVHDGDRAGVLPHKPDQQPQPEAVLDAFRRNHVFSLHGRRGDRAL